MCLGKMCNNERAGFMALCLVRTEKRLTSQSSAKQNERQQNTKSLYRPHTFVAVPEKCLNTARDRFSFDYVFHVWFPSLHAQQLMSRSNFSHTSSSPALQSTAYQNRTVLCLSGTGVHVKFASVHCASIVNIL